MTPSDMNSEHSHSDSCQITCAAFRAAFVTTLDSLLRYALDPSAVYERPVGIFDCFPMLNAVAPQIQLECLLRTWSRRNRELPDSADVLDDCVLHAACEALARVSTDKNTTLLNVVLNGPRTMTVAASQWLCSQARCLQVAGPEPLRPAFLWELAEIDEPFLRCRTECAADSASDRDELLNLVGRWVADREVVLGSHGLLTQAEQEMLQTFFEEHPGLVG